jgi:hypothetical protein
MQQENRLGLSRPLSVVRGAKSSRPLLRMRRFESSQALPRIFVSVNAAGLVKPGLSETRSDDSESLLGDICSYLTYCYALREFPAWPAGTRTRVAGSDTTSRALAASNDPWPSVSRARSRATFAE